MSEIKAAKSQTTFDTLTIIFSGAQQGPHRFIPSCTAVKFEMITPHYTEATSVPHNFQSSGITDDF